MDIRYYLDPDSGLPHIYGYGVTEADVEWVLRRPGEVGPSSGSSRQAVGQAGGGRYLRVIHVPLAVVSLMSFELNYDDAIHVDAEALAEAGIAEAYERVLPKLREFTKRPSEITEERDDDAPSYSVRCGRKTFVIYAPDIDDMNSWGNASVAFFTIVNDQLENSAYRFFAINGGNDLFGIFLTPAQAREAQEALPDKRHWPYLPKHEDSWCGQFH